MKLRNIIILGLVLVLSLNLVSAEGGIDTYTIKWIVPSEPTGPSAIFYISPSVEDKVPHIRLTERLDFTAVLSIIKMGVTYPFTL